MLIEIHMIQNHSPANLNRDDLGAPKTCYFGGVLRSRISSQCIKRSIRKSDEFKLLCGGIRTRRLADYLAGLSPDRDISALAKQVVQECGVLKDEDDKKSKKDVIVFLSRSAIPQMSRLLREASDKPTAKELKHLSQEFARLIDSERHMPDMALSGRMLEPGKSAKEVWKGLDPTIEAALQCAHAISTHEARPEVDYFIAADDVKGKDGGGAHIGEAMFSSACFYKYFSIHWETLQENLAGFGQEHQKLAAHTVGAFLRGAARCNPQGKQNSSAAHNCPDGILISINDESPLSYANAFAKPASNGDRDLISQSIAQLGQYVQDLDTGFGKPRKRFWFSPNLRHPLTYVRKEGNSKREIDVDAIQHESLDALIRDVIRELGHDWDEVRKVVVNAEVV